MASNTTKRSEKYEGIRITFESSQPFDAVLSKLYSSIGGPDKIGAWRGIVQEVTSFSKESKDAFIRKVNATVGPHGFMIFQDINHDAWIPLYGVGAGRRCRRIILGNPLVAITMLREDLTAGLAVPVELLVLEREGGRGTDLIYQLPSALIAGINKDRNLGLAAGELDTKLEGLMNFVAS